MQIVGDVNDHDVESGGSTTSSHFSGQPPSHGPSTGTEPAAVGVDLGSGY
jgi:hypothetical protein